MPLADIRQLRDLIRYRYKLTCFMSREKNRLQNCLTVSNIQFASVVSYVFTAIGIISKIGVNMEATPSAKYLYSWAGLTPTNNVSAWKKKSIRVSKARYYIKPLLVQCTNSVTTSEKPPEICNCYLRLRKRRSHKKAVIAIARILLIALYNMLRNKESYNAELYRKSVILPVNREITIEQAILMHSFKIIKSSQLPNKP